MTFNKINSTAARTYQAPDCDACKMAYGVIICQSGEIEDWVTDENEII